MQIQRILAPLLFGALSFFGTDALGYYKADTIVDVEPSPLDPLEKEHVDGTTTYYLDFSERLDSQKTYSVDEVFLELSPGFKPDLRVSDFLGLKCVDEFGFDDLDSLRHGTIFARQRSNGSLFVSWHRGSPGEAVFDPTQDGPGRTWWSDDDCWQLKMRGDDPLDSVKLTITFHEKGTIGGEHPSEIAERLRVLENDDHGETLNRLANARLEYGQNQWIGDPIDIHDETEKLVVLIHGWNPSDSANPYGHPAACAPNDSRGRAWSNLAQRLVRALPTEPFRRHDLTLDLAGWDVARFFWADEAATGDNPLLDANKARDVAVVLGTSLGDFLRDIPSLRFVHLIGHSAGSWVARSAARQLNDQGIETQITALDAFVNDGLIQGSQARAVAEGRPTDGTEPPPAAPASLAGFLDFAPAFSLTTEWVDSAQNYYVDDADWREGGCNDTRWGTDFVGYTSGDFHGWENRDLDPFPVPCMQGWMGMTHRGPVAWYADTVDPRVSYAGDLSCTPGVIQVGFAGAAESAKEPRLKITNPAQGAAVSGSLLLEAEVARGTAFHSVSKVEFGCGAAIQTRYPPFAQVQDLSLELDTTACGSGPRTIFVTAHTPFGRRREASVTVDVQNQSTPANQAPAPPNALRQRRSSSQTTVAAGNVLAGSSIDLSGVVADPDAGDRLTLEVELREVGSAFTGQPSSSCFSLGDVASGTTAKVRCPNLTAGQWRWRARSKDASGATSAWAFFGGVSSQPDFVVQEEVVQYQNGKVYGATSGDARLCHFHNGRCRLLGSAEAYLYFQPGDSTYSQVVRLPPDQFAGLAETSPCIIGGTYANGATPGCVHHDALIDGDEEYFVMGDGGGERLPASAIGTCFSASHVVEVPGIVFLAGIELADGGGPATYCAPGASSALDCGVCRRRSVGCSPDTCRPTAGNCTYQCGSGEVCLEDQCQSPIAGVSPGAITSPTCGSNVGSGGSTIVYQRGTASDGDDVQTGVECRRDNDPFSLIQGFSSSLTSLQMPILGPDEAYECRLVARRSGYWEPVVTSSSCRWFASGDRAQMEVREVTWLAPADLPNACSGLEIEAKVANLGRRSGSFRANAWLHPLGGSPDSVDAIPARKVWFGGTLEPDSEQTARFFIDPPSPLPLAPGAMEVTVEAWDTQEHNPPHRRSTTVADTDDEDPSVPTLRVDAFPGDPPVVVAGRSHTAMVVFADEYSLANWTLDWRALAGAWTPIDSGSYEGPGCTKVDGLSRTWTLPHGLQAGTVVELRARVTDAGNRSSERTVAFVVEETNEPLVAFVAPSDGDAFRKQTYEGSRCNSEPYAEPASCVGVELEVVGGGGSALSEIRVGFVEDTGDLEEGCEYDTTFGLRAFNLVHNPTSGTVRTSLRIDREGENWRVAAVTRDAVLTSCLRLGPRIHVDPPRFPPPWNPVQRDTSALWDDNYFDYERRQLSSPRIVDGQLVFDEEVEYHYWSDSSPTECAINTVRYDPGTLERTSTAPLIAPTANFYVCSFQFHDENLRYALYRGSQSNCDDVINESCDVPVFYQEISAGGIGPIRTMLYTNRLLTAGQWPSPLGVVSLPDGNRFVAVRSLSNESEVGPETDLYLMEPTGPRLLRTLAVSPSGQLGLDWVGGRPVMYEVRYTGEDDERMVYVDALHLSTSTGEVVSTEPVFAGLSSDTYWYPVRKSSRPRIVLVDSTEPELRILERSDDGTWLEILSQELPESWDGEALAWRPWPNLSFSVSADDHSLLWRWYSFGALGIRERFGVVPSGDPIPFTQGFEGPYRIGDQQQATGFGSLSWSNGPHPFLFDEGHLLHWYARPWGDFTSTHYFTTTDLLPAIAPVCDDQNLCTVDTWDQESGACRNDVVVVCEDDDDLCNGVPECAPETGTCQANPETVVTCEDDGDLCNGTPVCSPSTGSCEPGSPIDVSDGVSCTLDSCDPATGVVSHDAEDSACAPGLCEISRCAPEEEAADAISGCVTSPRPIDDDGLACTVGSCDAATGEVTHTLADDSCVVDGVCLSAGNGHPSNPCLVCIGAAQTSPEEAGFRTEPNGLACDDGRYCTVGDSCVDGRCRGQSRDCRAELEVSEDACAIVGCDESVDQCELVVLPDGAACTGGDVCQGAGVCTGASCVREAPLECDDYDPCTRDSCDPESGCKHEGAPRTSCDMSWEDAYLRVYDTSSGVRFRLRASSPAPLPPGGLGAPLVDDGGYSVCVYGDGQLAGRFDLDNLAETCPDRSCWREVRPEAYVYRNKSGAGDGVRFLRLDAGQSGEGRIKLELRPSAGTPSAAQIASLARELAGSSEATVQIVVGRGERCFGVAFLEDEIRDLGRRGLRAKTE